MSLCSVLRKVAAGTYIDGHFLYLYFDDCRMDSSLVRRYLYAKFLLPIATILGTEFVNGKLVIVQCYKYVSVVTYIRRGKSISNVGKMI